MAQFDDKNQWLCPISSLPEMGAEPIYDPHKETRSKAIDYLFRVGVQLQLSLSTILTASVYFHRFYLRFEFSDYPTHCVASASIFVATKSEECGRRLKDVATVCMAKASYAPPPTVEDDLPELHDWQQTILRMEDILIETLGFDLVVQHVHSVLSDVFSSQVTGDRQDTIEDLAWSVATDSYRTPLSILFEPATIASACIALAIAVVEESIQSDLDRFLNQISPVHTANADKVEEEDGDVDIDGEEGLPSSAALLKASLARQKGSMLDLKSAITILIQFYRFQWMPSKTLVPAIPGQDHFLAPIATIPLPKGVSEDYLLYKYKDGH